MSLFMYCAAVIVALMPLNRDVSADLLTHLTAALPVIHPAPTAVTAPYRATTVPVATTPAAAPLKLGAKSAYAVDLDSNQTLYSSDADTVRPIASITKMATALVIINKHKMNELITVPKLPSYTADDEIIGLRTGDSYTVHDLLAALLINSANDAADTLAIADSGSREAFAANMNLYMEQWGIEDAHFSNPSGLSDKDNGASAVALAKIGALALRNSTVTQLITTPKTSIISTSGRPLSLTTTNTLLQNGSFSGIKTGYTLAAGQCFIGLTSLQGHRVITVILGSQDRFGDTTRLAEWINSTYTWQ